MRYYWLRDRVRQGQFIVQWEPGKFNLADYFTEHHPLAHHTSLQPMYLFDANCIPDLQGCIKILDSRATGKLAATRTSPGTKSGIKSNPTKNKETGETQSSLGHSSGTKRALVQSSLKLAMLIKELKAHTQSPAA